MYPTLSSISSDLTDFTSIISLIISNTKDFFSPILLMVISIGLPTGPLINSTASVSVFP